MTGGTTNEFAKEILSWDDWDYILRRFLPWLLLWTTDLIFLIIALGTPPGASTLIVSRATDVTFYNIAKLLGRQLRNYLLKDLFLAGD